MDRIRTFGPGRTVRMRTPRSLLLSAATSPRVSVRTPLCAAVWATRGSQPDTGWGPRGDSDTAENGHPEHARRGKSQGRRRRCHGVPGRGGGLPKHSRRIGRHDVCPQSSRSPTAGARALRAMGVGRPPEATPRGSS